MSPRPGGSRRSSRWGCPGPAPRTSAAWSGRRNAPRSPSVSGRACAPRTPTTARPPRRRARSLRGRDQRPLPRPVRSARLRGELRRTDRHGPARPRLHLDRRKLPFPRGGTHAEAAADQPATAPTHPLTDGAGLIGRLERAGADGLSRNEANLLTKNTTGQYLPLGEWFKYRYYGSGTGGAAASAGITRRTGRSGRSRAAIDCSRSRTARPCSRGASPPACPAAVRRARATARQAYG